MTAPLPLERRVRERREPYVPVFDRLFDKHLSDAALGLYTRILRAAYRRRGEVALPRVVSDLRAVHDAIGGCVRSMRHTLPELVAAGLVTFGESRGQRVLQVPSWQRYRSRDEVAAVTVDGPSDDGEATVERPWNDHDATVGKKDPSDIEGLPDPSTDKEEEEEEEKEEGEGERAGRAEFLPVEEVEKPVDPVPEPDESGVHLRADLCDPPVTLPLPRSLAPAWVYDNLVPAVAEAIAGVTGAPWSAGHKDTQALVGLLALFAPQLTGLRTSEVKARFARAADRMVRALQDKPRKVQGWPMFLLTQWLTDNGSNARALTEAPPPPRPAIAKAAAPEPYVPVEPAVLDRMLLAAGLL